MTEQQIVAIVARNVTSLRLARGWTQTELARRLKRHAPWLNRLERGHAVPTLRTLADLGRVFKIEPSELLKRN
jgi:transcriptional regulator with XRE-family HTH domain